MILTQPFRLSEVSLPYQGCTEKEPVIALPALLLPAAAPAEQADMKHDLSAFKNATPTGIYTPALNDDELSVLCQAMTGTDIDTRSA